MVYTKTDHGRLFVLYSCREQVIAGAVVAGFAVVFALGSYASFRGDLDAKVISIAAFLGLVALALGGFAMSSFLSAWRRVRVPKWLFRFTPDDVHVNLLHPGYVRSMSSMTEHPLVIPLHDIEWIRQATEPGFHADDGDNFHVEMRLSDPAFRSVFDQRAAFRKSLSDLGEAETETVLRLYEGNVVRVSIEAKRWPRDIGGYWDANRYPVAASFTIEEPRDLEAARSRPRQIP